MTVRTTDCGARNANCGLFTPQFALRAPHFRVLAAILSLAGILSAQTPTVGQFGQTQQSQQTQQTQPTRPAEAPLFKFYVWGQVRAPGAYWLSANPDIVELLSAGGGPTEQSDLNRVVLVRGVDQRRRSINLRQLLNGGQTITLSPGDVVIIPEAFWYRFRDQLAIVTSLATFVTLYLTVELANRRTTSTSALGSRR